MLVFHLRTQHSTQLKVRVSDVASSTCSRHLPICSIPGPTISPQLPCGLTARRHQLSTNCRQLKIPRHLRVRIMVDIVKVWPSGPKGTCWCNYALVKARLSFRPSLPGLSICYVSPFPDTQTSLSKSPTCKSCSGSALENPTQYLTEMTFLLAGKGVESQHVC